MTNLSIDQLRKKKALEITLTLFKGPKGVREIRDAVEGSFTTIGKRIEELTSGSIVEEVYPGGMKRFKRPLPRRMMKLTDEGHNLVDSLIQSGFLRTPPLQKERHKWILLVLKIMGPVKGRTRLIKLLFLMKFRVGLKKEVSFKFRPWIYGPWSKDIIDDLRDLQRDGLIYEIPEPCKESEFKEEKVRYIYTLTPSGNDLTKELAEKISNDALQRLADLRSFNKMSLNKLLKFVYRNYPSFITNSAIMKRVLDSFDIEELEQSIDSQSSGT